MKITTIVCCTYLIAFALLACASALAGFNVILFFAFGNPVAYRCVVSLAGVAALWLLFWLIAFRPMKFLS